MLTGCASAPVQQLDPKVYHERSLKFFVNGIEYDGIAVLPERDSHTIKFKAFGDHDLFVLRTCGREVRFEKEGGTFKYVYTPTDGVERKAQCKISVASIDDRGRHGWASIYLDSKAYTHAGLLKCNGKQSNTSGVSACQSKQGLITEISFKSKTIAAKNKCGVPSGVSAKVYQFKTPNRECSVVFMGIDKVDGKRPRHLMHLTGHESSYMRKN